MSMRSLLAILAVAMLGACAPPPPEIFASSSQLASSAEAVSVGQNEVGEPCRYQPMGGGSGVPAKRDMALRCGSWEQPSGRIFELGSSVDASPLPGLVASGPWRAYVDQRYVCGGATDTKVLSGSPALIMQCTRRNGGWPHLALVTVVGGRVFAADGVRSALPALESALGSMAGQQVAAASKDGAQSEASRLIASRSGGSFGSGDEHRWDELTRLGDAYNNVDNPAGAEKAFREALAVQQKSLGPGDWHLALPMMKLAAQISHQRAAPEAQRLLDEAGTLVAKSSDPMLPVQLDYYRGVAAAYQGRVDDALKYTQAAEQGFTRLIPVSSLDVAEARAARAKQSSGIDLGALAESTNANNAAIAGLAEALRLHASLARLAGDTATSTQLATRADRLLDANGLAMSSTAARSLRLLASNAATAGNYTGAESFNSEAGKVFGRVVPGERPEAENMLQQGEYRLRQGSTDSALSLFRRAARILRKPGVVPTSPERILPYLDSLNATAGTSPEDRAKTNAEMFEAAQLARGAQTAQYIAEATARLGASDPKVGAALRNLQQKQREFDRLTSERDEVGSGGSRGQSLADIDARIAKVQQERDEAESQVQAASPRYRQTVESTVTEAEARGLLAPDEALMSFFVAQNGGYAFLLQRSGTSVYPIALKQAEIVTLIGQLRESTLPKAVDGQVVIPNYDVAGAYKLYSALFGPGARELQGKTRLTLAANGTLLSYPLGALVTADTPAVSDGDYRKVPFLLRSFALSYVPAPRTFVDLRRIKSGSPGARPFIGFGDYRPASDRQIAALFPPDRCAQDFRNLKLLGALPGTRTEIVTIGRQLGAAPNEIILGEAFTKAKLMAQDLSQYRVVHLATHALLPAELGRCQEEPAILTSLPPGAANVDAGFIRTDDIDNLKLDADLVVLSACDTAGPSQGAGESLSGLAQSFFRAGTRGMLVTHWGASDVVAMRLMTGSFAEHSGALGDTAQALQKAQLAMVDSAGNGNENPLLLSHPWAWSTFVLIGDGVRSRPGA